ncbi:MAG: sensor histidine kinase [Micromonosporaceae bacterium]
MSIRIRLAAAFTVLVAVILVLVGVVTYQLLRQSLLSEIERDVARRAAMFAATSADPPYDLDVFGAPDVFVQVVGDGGVVLARSGNLGDRTLPMPEAARRGEVVEVHADGRPLFLTAASLGGGRHVVVARSPITTYGALRQLRQLLSGVIAVAVLVTAVASWLYARAALSPIDRVVDAARQVRDSRDLTRRVPARGPPDEVGRLVSTFNDMLAELEQAYASLDRSNQQLRRFLADCSHELRGPLTRIRSTVDLLARTGEGDDGALRSRALADVASETDRMARMVRQLLILARADAGATIDPRPVRLDEVLDAAYRQAERMAYGLRLVPPEPGALAGAVVDGDADHLVQALLILLDNAFKYTPPPGEVRVEAGRDQAQARITVADSGLGVPDEDTDRIFERFQRGRNAGGVTGTGLGLAIARWIADQHHGGLRLDTSPSGSRFTLTLPLASTAAPAAAADQGV